jgi:hypothetical protein
MQLARHCILNPRQLWIAHTILDCFNSHSLHKNEAPDNDHYGVREGTAKSECCLCNILFFCSLHVKNDDGHQDFS